MHTSLLTYVQHCTGSWWWSRHTHSRSDQSNTQLHGDTGSKRQVDRHSNVPLLESSSRTSSVHLWRELSYHIMWTPHIQHLTGEDIRSPPPPNYKWVESFNYCVIHFQGNSFQRSLLHWSEWPIRRDPWHPWPDYETPHSQLPTSHQLPCKLVYDQRPPNTTSAQQTTWYWD